MAATDDDLSLSTVRASTRPPADLGDSTTQTSRRQAWVVTWMLLALMMINFADKAVLGLAHDPLLADLGISESQYGVISGGFYLLFSISAVAVGFLADRYPAKRLLLYMCLLWTISVIPLLGPAVSFGVLLGCRVLLGAAEGPTFGVAAHAVQKWFPDERRNLPVAILNVGATLGVVVLAPPLAAIIDAFGWRAAFATVGGVGVLWAVVWSIVGKEGPVGHDLTDPDADASRLAGRRVPLLRLLGSGTVLGSLAATCAAYWSLALLVAYGSPYLTHALGYSSGRASVLYALPWVLGAVVLVAQGVLTGRMMQRGIASRWARGVLAGSGLIVAAIATVLLVHVVDGPARVVCLMVAFSMSGMMFSVNSTVCGELAPPQQRGSVLGISVAVSALAGVVSPVLMGRLIDAAPDVATGYAYGFDVMAVVLAVGGLLAIALIRPERDAARLAARAQQL